MTYGNDNHKPFALVDHLSHKDYEAVHVFRCDETDLTAIIAVHSTVRGPAIGGCRLIEYSDSNDAIIDAIKLGEAMSYKAAIHELPHGGGKAVLIKPKNVHDRKEFFHKYASFVAKLNGSYITSVDSGTSPADMSLVLEKTSFVLGYNREKNHNFNDPSVLTALGIKNAIEAAITVKLAKSNLQEVTIAIQGAGNVGANLCKMLSDAGAKVIISDIDHKRATSVATTYGATYCKPEDILAVKCDVLAPCALGGIINENSVLKLNTKIICGAANNQLASEDIARQLFEKKILYVPDYLANGGGLIFVASNFIHDSDEKMLLKVNAIKTRTEKILSQASLENICPLILTNKIAKQNIVKSKAIYDQN